MNNDVIQYDHPDMVVISDDPLIQQRYMDMIAAGQSHNMAEMLALQSPPAAQTEDAFKTRFGTNNKQFDGKRMSILADQAVKRIRKKHPNWSPKGQIHIAGLGPMDNPDNWVDAMQARSEVKRKCAERNLDCDGMVKHKAREVEPQTVKYDPKLLRKETARVMQENPNMKPGEAREAATERLTPPKPEPPPSKQEMKAAMSELAKVAKGGA